MKILVLVMSAILALQGCSKSEDENKDSNGACKSEYLDSWNAVESTKSYSTTSQKASACLNLKNKGDVNCKAHIIVISGSGESGDRNISYADHKSYCDEVIQSSSPDMSSSNQPKVSTPPSQSTTSKYTPSQGNACSQSFIDLYNETVIKAGKFKVEDTLFQQKLTPATQLFKAATEFISVCPEVKLADSKSSYCYASKRSTYNYEASTTTASLSEFIELCDRAEKLIMVEQQIVKARSVRVFSKVEELGVNVNNEKYLMTFHSVSGATYLYKGVWYKSEQMKLKLAGLPAETVVCNISSKEKDLSGFYFANTNDIRATTEPVAVKDSTVSVLAHKVEIVLTKDEAQAVVKVTCLKNEEISLDDVQSSLGNSLIIEAIKLKN